MTVLTRSRMTSAVDFMAPFGTDRVSNDLVTTEGGFAVRKMPPIERFLARIEIEPATDCWVWQGKLSHGYGLIGIDGRGVRVHRFSVVGFYGDHARVRRRSAEGGDITGNAAKLRLVKEAMEIDWMTWGEANQAIPPAYTEYIGKHLLMSLEG